MLLKSKITDIQPSIDPIQNEKFVLAKLGRFTSSEIHFLMGERGIGQSGLNYIYRKVGEKISGRSSKQDISTAATEHGLNYEREGLVAFGKKIGIESLLVQRLILDDDGYCGGTPDGLIVLNESTDKLSYNVKTVEIKCPYTFDNYIRLWKCKTPQDLKKEESKYFWQVISQLDLCDCLQGYFVCYMPFFEKGNLNIIEFKKIDLINDFKLLAQRKNEAIKIFNETISELINGG